jgi:peptidoglycan hydrolase CwlO-like protein
LLIIFTFASFFSVKTIYAEDENCSNISDVTEKSKCLNDLIAKYQQQLNDARGQEKTLKSQLTYIDTQTKITELKKAEAENQIAKLEFEIDDLSGRITRLSETLDSLSQVLLNRIVQTYKHGNYSTIDLLFSSNGFSDLLERAKYISVAQANDKKVLYQLQATKSTYNDQKVDKETRQTQQEKLKKDLEKYQIQLAEQKKQKDDLLRITKNNEAIYQDKIRAAQEEQNAILAILKGLGNEISIGPVSKGGSLGYMISGRSACSTGTHLHFEVHQNGGLQDPNNFLSNISFVYASNDGGQDAGAISPRGSWDWPLDQPIITQGFGMTPYANAGAYNGGPHTGIDMYSSGLTVKAVRDGTLSRGGIACGSGTLYYKKVDQGDGMVTYYLHVL